ncbi:MAG TPA: hypothetical protein VME17_16820 [Bryobacteraceae bacterium]|nr:hypothetical protein [Bryobacteraceae bacterium]
MKRVLLRLLLIAMTAFLLLYLGDSISFRYRIPKGRAQFGSVDVQKLLAVPQKDRKTEYIADPPEPQQCVHSLFPQLGLTPCWYLSRHPIQQVNY